MTTSFSMSGAGASGGIVSTPLDLGRFFRAYLRGDYFGPAEKRAQRRFVLSGASDPPGPGANSAGLALFHYRTRCGTVYGHTGSFLGYAQWAAARADGRRSATTTLNIPRRRARCSLASGGCRHPWCARCCGSSGAELGACGHCSVAMLKA